MKQKKIFVESQDVVESWRPNDTCWRGVSAEEENWKEKEGKWRLKEKEG